MFFGCTNSRTHRLKYPPPTAAQAERRRGTGTARALQRHTGAFCGASTHPRVVHDPHHTPRPPRGTAFRCGPQPWPSAHAHARRSEDEAVGLDRRCGVLRAQDDGTGLAGVTGWCCDTTRQVMGVSSSACACVGGHSVGRYKNSTRDVEVQMHEPATADGQTGPLTARWCRLTPWSRRLAVGNPLLPTCER